MSVNARRIIDSLTVVVLASVGIGLGARWWRSEPDLSGGRGRSSGVIKLAKDTVTRLDPLVFADLTQSAHWLGPKEAAVVIVVFSDYGCGHCARYHETLGQLMARYPQHVGVALKQHVVIQRPVPMETYLAAECAKEQGAFESFHDAAFQNSRYMAYRSGWRRIAEAGRISDLDQMARCVASRRHLAKLTQDAEDGLAVGVDGTPVSFVNGRRIDGAVDLSTLDSAVAYELRLLPGGDK
jgi:protein-disulfide isomerase